MAVRVVEFTFEGITVRLAAMSWKQAEAHAKEAKEFIERGHEVTIDEWKQRTIKTVRDSISRTGDVVADPETFTDEFDIPTINAMFSKVLEISGLRATSGEAPAAQTSPSSAAA
jgi:hypothetical protein